MLNGELYDAQDPELSRDRLACRNLCKQFNESDPDETDRRRDLLNELFAESDNCWIEPPFHCDYGSNIYLGKNVYFNFNCIVLDVGKVTIGDNVLIGPSVQIYAATHPTNIAIRKSGLEYGAPLTIESDAWIGGGSIICPGVTIGSSSVIGAGSVVTKDIPAKVIAAGNPAKVIRPIADDA